MTSTTTTPAIANLTRPGGALDLGHDRARMLIHMFGLLVRGRPVARDHAIESVAGLGIDRVRAADLLDAWAERDDAGDIVGIGVTHNPTPHEMTIDGVRTWAWCGMDTLIFAHLLGKPIDISSTAPGSGEVVRLRAGPSGVTGVEPASAVVTQRVPADDQVDLGSTSAIWGTFCHHNHFFPSRAAAEQWADGRDDIVILSIADGFAAARDMADALSRYEPPVHDKVAQAVSMTRASFRQPDLVPHVYRLLAEGEPVTVERVAAAGGWRAADVRAELARQPGTEWDDDGRVVGFGISIRPTPHAFHFAGRTVYGWCATAILELPIILGRGGVGESTCRATGRPVRVELTPDQVVRVDPADAVVSKVRPADGAEDVRAEICDLGNFFSSPEAATKWLAHNPRGETDPITTEFAVTRRALRELGWAAGLSSETGG